MQQDHGQKTGGPLEIRELSDRFGNPVRVERLTVERGQTTVALAAVLALAVLLGGMLATIAGAMVHRQRAQTAADAVALAAVVDAGAADELVTWYNEHEVLIEFDAGRAAAVSGPAAAEAWAVLADADVSAMPALVAIVARAEQLTGEPFASVRVVGDRVELDAADGATLRLVASELGLCERSVPGVPGSRTGTTFGLC